MEIAAVNTSPFHVMLQRRNNVWYSVKDGNWEDPNVWMSNGLDKRIITVPQSGDTVYICHTVNFDGAVLSNTIINDLFILGKLTASNNSQTLTLNGNLYASGFIDFTGSNITLNLNGVVNSAIYSNFIAGNSTINFGAINNDQFILNLPYKNLSTSGAQKYMASDLTIAGTFSPQSNFECGAYNLTVNGASTIGTTGQPGKFTKNSSTGSLLFIGNADFEGLTDLSVGNPTVECRGGINIHTFSFTAGSGTWTFSTNNQTISCSAWLGGTWNGNILVSGAITVTLTGGTFQTNGTINGTAAGSTFNNNGVLWIGYNHTPMVTGVFNYQNTASSTLGYVFNGNYTLPYTSYANLFIGGNTGIKSLGAATIVNQSLVIGYNGFNGSVLDCAGNNLDVKGAFTCYDGFLASAFSNITFEGAARFDHGGSPANVVDLRTGNPNVEFRAGLTVSVYSAYTGTGTFKFTTANQNLDFSIVNGGALACNWLISGAITVTLLDGASNNPAATGTINGDNASSTFDCRGYFQYQNATAPMTTGKLYCNQATNTFLYSASGNQDIQVPSDPIPGYKNLTLSGSGAKRLLGNVSVKGTYTLTSPATLNSNGFSLTNP
ncbi:MAG: hypothetical protein JO080_01145 [Mucilaginibacter sp.]|nr:hypothetical protein [Mucilaginibacter sp.]